MEMATGDWDCNGVLKPNLILNKILCYKFYLKKLRKY